MTPTGPNGEPSDLVEVTGVGTVPKCPRCDRKGPLDALWLGQTKWPNIAIICGEPCGIYWAIGNAPADLVEVIP